MLDSDGSKFYFWPLGIYLGRFCFISYPNFSGLSGTVATQTSSVKDESFETTKGDVLKILDYLRWLVEDKIDHEEKFKEFLKLQKEK